MHRVSWLTFALVAAPFTTATAQVQRWNDRAPVDNTPDAPTVSLTIDGARVFSYRSPVRVRFSVSDNAYVVVARVASDGRLTIIYPQTRGGRTYVRGKTEQIVRGRETGAYSSFYTTEPPGTGFVFAIASYAPLDLSAFKNADFERRGLASPFQLASRNLSLRPESMIERFASWVLFDDRTPFDYDVDFYSVDMPQFASEAGLCMGASDLFYGEMLPGNLLGFNPSYLACNSYYNTYMWCLPLSIYSYNSLCGPYARAYITRGGELGPATMPPATGDTTHVNRGVIGGGLWQPDTVARVGDNDPRLKDNDGRTEQRVQTRGGKTEQDWDRVYSIPDRSLDQLRRTNSPRPAESGPGMRSGRGYMETEARGSRPTVNEPSPQRRAESTHGTEAPARESEQPRRVGTGGGSNPRGADAPPRDTPRSYSPPQREAPPPRETPRTSTEPAHQAPRAEPSGGSSPKSEPAPQPVKGSSTSGEPKKPPM